MVACLLITFFILLFTGVPIIFTLSGSVLMTYLLYAPAKDIIVVPQIIFAANDSFALLAIPFFVLAGNLMGHSGISRRLVSCFESLVGFLPGGLAVVVVVSCMFFGAISGSAPATVAAIGTILIPYMAEKNYNKEWTAALTATSGTLGAIIPPSIPMILFGVLSGTSITGMFAAGFIPGAMLALFLAVYAIIMCYRKGFRNEKMPSPKAILKSLYSATGALLMPIIILGGIYSGVFTPTESAAVASAYGLLVGLFGYKELKIKELPRILTNSAVTSASIMLIITTAAGFASILTRFNIPTLVANTIISAASTPMMFFLLFSGFILVLGCFMSVTPALVILTPIMMPAVHALDINPFHFGIVFVILMCIGTVTPPFGLDLFVSCGIANVSVSTVSRRIIPFLIIYLLVVVLLIVFPILSTFGPSLIGISG
jgi:C4-dicarboxylate transporter DctM subunit